MSVRCSGEKGMDIDCHTVEFDDVRYHIQVSSILSHRFASKAVAKSWQQMDGNMYTTMVAMARQILASILIIVKFLG